jgi:aldehyde dehydrogenase (NAD+)
MISSALYWRCIGKVVMEAAARNLTPVTLELGGKSPCVVDETANIDLAAKRIVWGKFINAGQTCVAPDYLLVHKKVRQPLLAGIEKYIKAFYGIKPETNDEYPRIITQKHYERLLHLLENEEIAIGGQHNDATRQLAPTVITNATWSSPVMQEEIFGPILPVLAFESFDDAMKLINARPKPLAFYLFTENKERENKAMQNVSFGGGCINDTVIHLGSPYLRFGGVGESGMGQYHGKGSFDTFTHYKSVMKKSNHMDIPIRYPPYKDRLSLLKRIMK